MERLVRAAGFEIRCRLGEPDPGTRSLFEAALRRTPAERLAGAARAARFVQRGRSGMKTSAMPEPAFDPETLLAALHREDVRFVLIGGMAAVLHGDVGVTVDVDIAPARDASNLERLAAALRSLDARVRAEGAPDGLAFDCSPAFFENLGPGAILNLTTRAGALDIAFVPAGTAGYGT